MDILILWFVSSFVVMHFAKQKGQSEGLYLIISLALSPIVGGLLVLIAKNKKEEQSIKYGVNKKCPLCAEVIKSEAIKCKYCGASVSDGIPIVTDIIKNRN